MNKKFKIFFTAIIALGIFIMAWAPIEYAIACPLAKDEFPEKWCMTTKSLVWEFVATISLYTSDGIYLTTLIYNEKHIGYDEMESKSIFPITIVGLIGTSYYLYSTRNHKK